MQAKTPSIRAGAATIFLLLLAAAAPAGNTNSAGATLHLAGPSYWSAGSQQNTAGAVLSLIGPAEESAPASNSAGARLLLNPLDLRPFVYEPIPGDFNGDGRVDLDDLLILLDGWGTGYNLDDLLALLDNWGAGT